MRRIAPAAGLAVFALAACTTTAPERAPAAPEPAPAREAATAKPQAPAVPAIAMDTPARCIAAAIYHEARAETERGQRAVGAVIVNRAAHQGYPGDACAVVKEGGETPPCQFSWWCDGRADEVGEPEAYEAALRVAEAVLGGAPDPTGGATSFHAVGVSPAWASSLRRTATIGGHVFYAPE